MGASVGLGSCKCLADQVRLLQPRSVGALGHVGSFHGQGALASLHLQACSFSIPPVNAKMV